MKTTTQLVEGITPLPWTVNPKQDILVGSNNAPVIVSSKLKVGLGPATQHRDADNNAAYIVKACNSLPKLVEALQVIAGMEFDFNHSAQHREEALKIVARAVLKEVLS